MVLRLRDPTGGVASLYKASSALLGLNTDYATMPNSIDDPRLREVLSKAFQARLPEVMDQSQHASTATASAKSGVGGVDQAASLFLAGMDEWEKERTCIEHYVLLRGNGQALIASNPRSFRSWRNWLSGHEDLDRVKTRKVVRVKIREFEIGLEDVLSSLYRGQRHSTLPNKPAEIAKYTPYANEEHTHLGRHPRSVTSNSACRLSECTARFPTIAKGKSPPDAVTS